ncbi:unnamed protein product [Lymnaea stagnalis]|uniref:G-protein coupled receptors family 1 profile domain-containing protein n=1 Tax=Lymnaea stagnalis TaxID=6523 RepID=A0AAV2H6X8_LYMST
MLVLFRHGMDDSSNIVLIGLSLSDLIYSCSETYTRIMYITARIDSFIANNLLSVYVAFFLYISTYGTSTSVWLVALISIERMIAVCFPFHVSRLMSPVRMRFMVVFVFTFVAIFYSPSFCMYYLDLVFNKKINRTVLTSFKRKEYIDNLWWLSIFLEYILPSFMNAVPMITILTCTFATIVNLIKANKNSAKISNSRAKRVKEMRSIKIALIICCSMAFSILIPTAFLDAYSSYGLNINTTMIIYAIDQLAVQTNATMNFFIYVALSSKFKSKVLKMFQCTK